MGVFGFFLFLSVVVVMVGTWRSIKIVQIKHDTLVRMLNSGHKVDKQELELFVASPPKMIAWTEFKIGVLLLLGGGAIIFALVYWEEGMWPVMIAGLVALLVALAKLGSKTAFSELVKRHQSPARILLRRLSGDARLAEDLSQQVFLSAWVGMANLCSVDAFPAWLRKLAVNIWLKHYRKKNPVKNAEDIDEILLAAPKISIGAGIDIDNTLALLSGEERMCILLCYHEGMIAELTGLPPGTVKSHIVRGNKKLRKFLSAYNGMTSETMGGNLCD